LKKKHLERALTNAQWEASNARAQTADAMARLDRLEKAAGMGPGGLTSGSLAKAARDIGGMQQLQKAAEDAQLRVRLKERIARTHGHEQAAAQSPLDALNGERPTVARKDVTIIGEAR